MTVGVMGFYFVLSDINAVVSNAIRKDIEFSARLSMLEKIQIKYQLQPQIYKNAKMSLYEDEFRVDTLDFDFFYSKFPISLREDLKFHVNSQKLSQFCIFKDLDRKIMNRLSECLQEMEFEPSKPDQTKSFTTRTTRPRTSSSSARGRP